MSTERPLAMRLVGWTVRAAVRLTWWAVRFVLRQALAQVVGLFDGLAGAAAPSTGGPS